MLPRRYRLVNSADFGRVHSEGKSWSNSRLVLCAAPNGLVTSRFGFAVSRKIGTAVVRNRCKRILREIVRSHLDGISAGWDIVVIVRRPFAGIPYQAAERVLLALLGMAEMLTVESDQRSNNC